MLFFLRHTPAPGSPASPLVQSCPHCPSFSSSSRPELTIYDDTAWGPNRSRTPHAHVLGRKPFHPQL